MEIPLELSFENIEKSEALEARIRESVDRLDAMYHRLVACRVSVSMPHESSRKGQIPRIRIEMSVPGDNLVISDEPHRFEEKYKHADIYNAVDEAFAAAERRLRAFKERKRGDVKTHGEDEAPPLVGIVTGLRPDEDYGFLRAAEGGELWFHRNAVAGAGFEALGEGDIVHYVETVGESGPQASTVIPAAGVAGAKPEPR